VVSETDLANALERVSAYVSTRATEATKITPLNVEPAQNPHNRATEEAADGPRAVLTPRKKKWRRAESNCGPRDYERDRAPSREARLTRPFRDCLCLATVSARPAFR
jgi:hypothetical protein